MPLQIGSLAIHDDGQHTGSAKRGAASGIASLDAASKVVEEPATKGAANGIASLDAGSQIPIGQLITHGRSKHDASVGPLAGTYAGNSSANRAIPHGLGRAPVCVCLVSTTNAGITILESGGKINTIYENVSYLATQTAWDSTNFYVGLAAPGYSATGNMTGQSYYWVAF